MEFKNNYDDAKEFISLVKTIGINYSPTSEKVLEDMIGEKLNYKIMEQLVKDNQVTWIKLEQDNMPQSYRFGALKQIVTNDYIAAKKKLSTQNNDLDLTSVSYKFVYNISVQIQDGIKDAIVHEVQNNFGETWETYKLDRDFVIEALTREAERRKSVVTPQND